MTKFTYLPTLTHIVRVLDNLKTDTTIQFGEAEYDIHLMRKELTLDFLNNLGITVTGLTLSTEYRFRILAVDSAEGCYSYLHDDITIYCNVELAEIIHQHFCYLDTL